MRERRACLHDVDLPLLALREVERVTRRAHLPPERQIELLEDDLRRKEMELLECHAALRSIKAIAIERVGK